MRACFGLPFISLPTIISSCAFVQPDGDHVRHVRRFEHYDPCISELFRGYTKPQRPEDDQGDQVLDKPSISILHRYVERPASKPIMQGCHQTLLVAVSHGAPLRLDGPAETRQPAHGEGLASPAPSPTLP